MPLDFSKIQAASTSDTLINPREIFSALPSKNAKYRYLRDVQAEVLDQWFERRNASHLRLKMNTGAGKTLLGLMILKSCINESKGPAVYVAPTPYLVSQVLEEAKSLGLAAETEPRSAAVARGRAILVTHIHVLLNGKSKFGVGEIQLPIGSVVVDDVHACLATAEEQFTLRIPSTHATYQQVFDLLRPELEQQSPTSVLDVAVHEPYKFMLVPFWAWSNKCAQIEAILHPCRDDEALQWAWPLLHQHLRMCRCVIGAGRIEFSPRCLPVSVVPSFTSATRHIFMSATFADDSVLVTDFAADPAEIEVAIAPTSASDLGDRMILVPQELNPSLTNEQIRDLAVAKSKEYNVVVIVPSNRRADFWRSSAAQVLIADNLEAGVAQLRKGHVGLVVIVNKYDGIDLPDNACRILILDDIPDARRAIDRIEQSQLQGTSIQVGKSIQQIEQGMGRGVRANDDYCVVLLMGPSLVGQLFTQNGIRRFTPATAAQFQLSEQIGNQIRGKGIDDISNAVEYCLSRNQDWVTAAKSALVHVKYDTASSDTTLAVARRQAFDAASNNDYATAKSKIQEVVNKETNTVVKGWLMAELAEYTQLVDAVEAQQILKSAQQLNRQLLRPQAGIAYQRLSPTAGAQAIECLRFLQENFARPNELLVAANAIANDLIFCEDFFKTFERAMHDAANLLGFKAQRPESEFGAGPDTLWAVGNLRYFVIECKNGAITNTINKKDTNQLAGSINWFVQRYDQTCQSIPILVHPAATFEDAATPPPGTRIVTKEKLPIFCDHFRQFVVAVARLTNYGDAKAVSELLNAHNLLPDSFVRTYTVPPTNR